MSFADHKITEFTHRITDLPDQPTLSPQELKARFDSSPEELRQAHNAVCDEGERLSARVEGIVTDTFGNTIDREMLSHELAAELDAKADETAVMEKLTAESTAREELAARVTAAESTLPQKCEICFGIYTPSSSDNTDRVILGFRPKAVLMVCAQPDGSYVLPVQLATRDTPHQMITITENSFSVAAHSWRGSAQAVPYRYIAFK